MKALPKSFKWWIVIFFVAIGIVALALWLDFRYQPPSFTLVNFSVPPSSDSNQHPDIHVALHVKNPNNVYSISYDYIIIIVYYAKGTLGKTNDMFVPPNEKKQETSINTDMKTDVHQLEALRKAISKSPGEARLKVELHTEIKYKNLGYNSKKTKLTYQGEFNIGSDGELLRKKKVKLCKGSC